MFQVAFYLAKYGETAKSSRITPPKELNTTVWNTAYRIFYNELNGGRSRIAFQNTMKHTRDDFDSHLPTTNRRGWYNKDGTPKKLSPLAAQVFEAYSQKTRKVIWREIKRYADLDLGVKKYDVQYEDVMGFEEAAIEYESKSKTEGGLKIVISAKYEREPKLRQTALDIHGYDCMVCGFNFEEIYGDWGKDFAEVHHLVPLHENKGEKRITNPKTDLAVLCANCHRMVHRKPKLTLTIEELKQKLKTRKSCD